MQQAASLVAAVEIYASMEEAGRLVLQSTGQATTDLVTHTCVHLFLQWGEDKTYG